MSATLFGWFPFLFHRSVIRVFNCPRTPKLGSLVDSISHMRRIYEKETLDMLLTGPRQGEMSEKLKFALISEDDCVAT